MIWILLLTVLSTIVLLMEVMGQNLLLKLYNIFLSEVKDGSESGS